MSAIPQSEQLPIHYPDSDGQPMSDNTIQFTWIALVMWNLEHQFAARPDVFVAGDHLIYPIEGDPDTRQAPDVYVAFGPHKGDRGSYKVWEEGGIFPQVVFEIWSPSNRADQMEEKREFYERHGAEEYYLIYPEFPGHVQGWQRHAAGFIELPKMNGWTSPRLGIRFQIQFGKVAIIGPDGKVFQTPAEIAAERDEVAAERDEHVQLAKEERERAQEQARLAQEQQERADEQTRLAKHERERAEEQARLAKEQQELAEEQARLAKHERERAEEQAHLAKEQRERADEQARLAENQRERAEKFAARLRELGIDPDNG